MVTWVVPPAVVSARGARAGSEQLGDFPVSTPACCGAGINAGLSLR